MQNFCTKSAVFSIVYAGSQFFIASASPKISCISCISFIVKSRMIILPVSIFIICASQNSDLFDSVYHKILRESTAVYFKHTCAVRTGALMVPTASRTHSAYCVQPPSKQPPNRIRRDRKKEKHRSDERCFFVLALPIFPGRLQPSIVSRSELNFRVRDGNGWTLALISTNYRSQPHTRRRPIQFVEKW